MARPTKSTSRLVYSTESGRNCPRCQQRLDKCQCVQPEIDHGDGIVRIRRETKGRGGKAVTLIAGIPLPADELKTLAKKLKKICGSGGSVKGQLIEIQGDQRERCKETLEKAGYSVKFSGG